MKNEERINIRVTPAEKAKIESLAAAYGCSVSEYIRRSALGNVAPPPCEFCEQAAARMRHAVAILTRQ